MYNWKIKWMNWFLSIIFSLISASLFWSCQTEQQPKSNTAQLQTEKQNTLPKVDSIFETFEHKTEDTTYLMKKYFVCFLKEGPKRDQDEATAAKIQEEHMAHMAAAAKANKICASGPMGDDGPIKGIIVYSVANQTEAEKLANSDPAVIAGRLKVEIHPWWAAVGTTLF